MITKLYGLRMKVSKLTGMGIKININGKKATPKKSFYELEAKNGLGEVISFERFRGKKVILVNLASQCGFTPQYNDLEALYQGHKNEIMVLGFPSNDFGAQEPGTDEEIQNFCKINFGITFPLFRKDHVKGIHKQAVYQWLCEADKNGWNNEDPTWNFYKYVVDEQGNLEKISSSSVSPLEAIRP